jgi:transcriptional regulator with XRE-family HTH domain
MPGQPNPQVRHSAAHDCFGRVIRELRARRGLSQEQLGFQSGLHRNYVGAIERGEINPTFRVLLKLEHGLRLPLSEIIEVYETRRGEGVPGGYLSLLAHEVASEPIPPVRERDR